MKVRELHRWDVSPEEARAIQHDLAGRLVLQPAISMDEVRLVAGVDDGYVRHEGGETAFAAVVVLSFPDLSVVETATASVPVTFPYVPGFLSFREAPAILAAVAQLEREPDLWLVDGHGYAHPRRIGIASHLGLVLDRPSAGCAKSRLVGRWEEPGQTFGDRTPIVDRGEVVGMAVRTRPGHAPLLVSPGHKLDVAGAVEAALACCREGRFLPESTRLAHELVTETTRPFRRSKNAR
jgi:deoxyribonuclease V